jgi:pimeloyl-ACP methyl ester carboxylesterase
MRSVQVLPGIIPRRVSTRRLEIACLALVHGNCSSSHFFQDFMLALAAGGRYTVHAPDMRGYGESQALPAVHLPGWSLGGNIVMQYIIDHPAEVRTLTLQATGSPFGFEGTRDVEGTLTWPDYAGSGGGAVNAAFASRIACSDCGHERFSPRTVMNACYFIKPPFRVSPEREEVLVSSILSMKVSDDNYSADRVLSPNWPGVAPGTRGVNNALSPKYLNQEELVDLATKPPVLGVHGAADQVVSDTSLFDRAFWVRWG